MKKVCFITERLAARSGGAERVLIETANAVAERGYLVDIVTHERDGRRPFYPLRFGVSITNIRTPDAFRGRLRLRLDRWRDDWHRKERTYRFPVTHFEWLSKHGAYWRRLEKFVNLHRPDVAIAFLPSSIVALGMIRPDYPLRRIASLHNVPERDLCDPRRWDPNPLDRKRRMSSLRRHDAITVLQPEFREWFPKELHERISVIPNVVVPITAARIARHTREKTVLSVGRLAAVKRHGMLIDAWASIADKHPDWTLKIFGKGPLERKLRHQIERLNLKGNVRLMGHTFRIDKEYLTASIVVHPAEHEGWGLAASEALAAGVPVVGFASCPGINYLIQDGINGILVKADGDQSTALANALSALIEDEKRRRELARFAPQTVCNFAPEKVYDLWETLL